MSERNETTLTLEDHHRAFTEVSFLMDIFIHTMKDLVGGGTASVARNAGRTMGKKLPIYLEKPSFEEALGAVLEYMSAGFEFEARYGRDSADITYRRCAIREVCENRGIAPGGELCKVFHGFVGGIVNEHYGRPVRTSSLDAQATRCVCRMESV